MTTEMKFGARTDIGCVRENNEDSYRLAPDMNLYVLSDGMGGLEAGEVASRMADIDSGAVKPVLLEDARRRLLSALE